jgi:hypothetical protein
MFRKRLRFTQHISMSRPHESMVLKPSFYHRLWRPVKQRRNTPGKPLKKNHALGEEWRGASGNL